MKTILYSFIALTALFLASCTPNNPQPNPSPNTSSSNSVTVMWQGTIDGNAYNYTGTYVNLNSTSNYMNNPGRADGTYSNVILFKGVVPGNNGKNVNIILNFPLNVNPVGTHILNNSNNNGFYLGIVFGSTDWAGNTLDNNSNITLNITEFPSNIGGLIKGNFSGVLETSSLDLSNPNISTRAVSISFEAIRKY